MKKEGFRDIEEHFLRIDERESGRQKREQKLSKLRSEIEGLKRERDSLKRENVFLSKKVKELERTLKEKDEEIRELKGSQVLRQKFELFIEVVVSNVVSGKLLMSKEFRKDLVREMNSKPFLFESFLGALRAMRNPRNIHISGHSYEIYTFDSPFGTFQILARKIDKDTTKLLRFLKKDEMSRFLESPQVGEA